MTHSFFRAPALAVLALSGVLCLPGCNQIDPLTRPYMWHESGANRHNIAAMAANPADLNRGRHTSRRRAATDLEAVDRVWTGRPVPLHTNQLGAAGAAPNQAPAPLQQTGGS